MKKILNEMKKTGGHFDSEARLFYAAAPAEGRQLIVSGDDHMDARFPDQVMEYRSGGGKA